MAIVYAGILIRFGEARDASWPPRTRKPPGRICDEANLGSYCSLRGNVSPRWRRVTFHKTLEFLLHHGHAVSAGVGIRRTDRAAPTSLPKFFCGGRAAGRAI